MKIFLPFQKELNPYLEEIINYSQHTYTYAPFQEYNSSYQVVSIHWPEAIFNWKEPTLEELQILEQNILDWKRNSVIVYTKHDFERNKGTTTNFTKLFNLIERHTDVFIHLGKFSQNFYKKKFLLAQHEIIHHPIFKHSLKLKSKINARKLLGIDQESTVIIAPGNIRSFEERKMVVKSFNSLKINNKVLISTNMRTDLQYDFYGRVWLKKYIDIKKYFINRFKKKYQPPKYIFNYGLMSAEDLCLRVASSDVVLVPRINILNSGIVFLGLTFGKVIVGPATGNIEEQLKELNYPVFNPNFVFSVTEALQKGIKLHMSGEYSETTLTKYQPINVANEYDRIFLKYKKQ